MCRFQLQHLFESWFFPDSISLITSLTIFILFYRLENNEKQTRAIATGKG